MKKSLTFLLLLSLHMLDAGHGVAAENEECPVGTSKFDGAVCVSLLDHCLTQGRLVEEEGCDRKCPGGSFPDVIGAQCQDDTDRLRPVLMMTGLKEILETQLVNLRGALDTSGLRSAIRDIEQIPTLAGLAEKDRVILTDALAELYDVEDSDIVLDTYFRYLTERINTRVTRIEDALHETQDGYNKIGTVLRNIRNLYREFVYKIKDLNDEIERKRDSVTSALTRLAVFEEMLAGVKQNKKTLDKSKLVSNLFSTLQTTYIQVDNEYNKNGTQKAVMKALNSLPRFISIGFSLFSQSDNGREIQNKIQRSLKAVGTISSRLSSSNWELIQTSGSFLSLRNKADKLRGEKFGPNGALVSESLISEALSRCRDLMELAEIL